MLAAIAIDWPPFHQFHDEERPSVVSRPTVNQTRDVRMFESCQDLPLMPKARQHPSAVHASLDDFDRNQLAILLIIALAKIDKAHPAASYFLEQPVGAYARTHQRSIFVEQRIHFGSNSGSDRRRAGRVRPQQRLNFRSQCSISFAGSI